MIKSESLLYFYYVAKYNSITKAAEKLHITPSAISIAIKKLENDLNLVLFNRNAKGVQLTPAGNEILGKVVDILFSFNQLIVTAQQINDSKTHFCEIEYLYFFSDERLFDMYLEKISQELYEFLPNLDLIVSETTLKNALENLSSTPNSAALLFLSNHFIDILKNKYIDTINFKILENYPIGIFANSKTKWLSQSQLQENTLSLNDLTGKRFIKPTWGSTFQYTNDFLLKKLSEHEPVSTTLAPNYWTLRSFLFNDVGLAFGLPIMNKTDSFSSKVLFIPLDTTTSVSLTFLCNSELQISIQKILFDTISSVHHLYS